MAREWLLSLPLSGLPSLPRCARPLATPLSPRLCKTPCHSPLSKAAQGPSPLALPQSPLSPLPGCARPRAPLGGLSPIHDNNDVYEHKGSIMRYGDGFLEDLLLPAIHEEEGVGGAGSGVLFNLGVRG